MIRRIARLSLRHRGAITVALVAVLLTNLTVIGRLDPPEPGKSDLPVAARCQGGGPGCAEQPLIPPPIGGLPHFDAPPAPVFGALVAVEPERSAAVIESPPDRIERPPVPVAA